MVEMRQHAELGRWKLVQKFRDTNVLSKHKIKKGAAGGWETGF